MRGKSAFATASVVAVLLLVQLCLAAAALAGPGDLDPTFSKDGRATIRFGTSEQAIDAVAVGSDGSVVGVGYSHDATSDAFAMAIVRLHSDGTPDRSFSADGKRLVRFGFSAIAWDVAIQPDGKIVVVGAVSGAAGDGFGVIRLDPDGSFDRTFGGNGKVFTDFGFESNAEAVALLPGGDLVVAGSAGTPDGHQNVFGVARYLSSGRIDRTFGRHGKVRTRMGAFDFGRDVAVGESGRIVVVGSTFRSGTGRVFAVAAYTSQGVLDRSFSRDGIALTQIGLAGFAESVLIQPDGRVVVAGSTQVSGFPNGRFAVARYDPDGALDPTFGGGDGKVLTNVNPSDGGIKDVALDADGSILAVGAAPGGLAVLRYLPEGSLDPVFGVGGIASVSFDRPSFGNAIAVSPGYGVVAAGSATVAGSARMAFARLLD